MALKKDWATKTKGKQKLVKGGVAWSVDKWSESGR